MRSPEVIRELLVLNLNQLADVMESKARAYRAVANDLMNGTGHEAKKKVRRRHYDDPSQTPEKHRGGFMKGKKYKPGTHWMQKPENRARLMKTIRKMHQARHRK